MTKIKICGLTTLQDAHAAIDAGADLLGFNFYPPSPRYLAPEACAPITSVLGREFPHILLVGVFVNAPITDIRAILETCQLHLAQLHGDEPPEILAELGQRAFKAIRLKTEPGTDLEAENRIQDAIRFSASRSALSSALAPTPALLVDAAVKGVYGGSGMVADWQAAEKLAKRVPLLLAGGLTPENVGAAVRQVQPWGVDVASGVESSPGVKDSIKMQRFVEEVRKIQ